LDHEGNVKSTISFKHSLGLMIGASTLLPLGSAFAQEAQPEQPPPAEPAPPAEPPPAGPPPFPAQDPGAPAPPAAEATPAPAKAPETAAKPERFPTVFAAPTPPPPPPKKRKKPLLMSVGLPPTASDFGAEADIVAPMSKEPAQLLTRKWHATVRAFLRAPARVGLGPRNDQAETTSTSHRHRWRRSTSRSRTIASPAT
jgi:hypothetical protein